MKPFRYTAKQINAAIMRSLNKNGGGDENQFIADELNALLEAHEAKCERVYGNNESPYSDDKLWANFKHKTTHTALLWNVQPVGEGE